MYWQCVGVNPNFLFYYRPIFRDVVRKPKDYKPPSKEGKEKKVRLTGVYVGRIQGKSGAVVEILKRFV